MPKSVFCKCRGFSLAVPVLATLAYAYWLQPAIGGDPDATNALLGKCVDRERAAGRSGRACIGKVTEPCKAMAENDNREDRIECDEREFVLWALLLKKEFAALEKRLDPRQREKLQQTQGLWVKYQSEDCRVPYILFSRERAEFAGPACTIELKAARTLQLRAWRDALSKGK